MDGARLRAAFTGYFAEHGHTVVPSASLIPHDPTVLFTIAGMVPFKPYFLGEEAPPWPRATSVQKCFRTVDIDIVGTTTRHCTFFEMLGNFSFGDYFKEQAIAMAWELLTERLGLEGDRLWVTVHESDADASGIWQDAVGMPAARIQAMGEDNFWRMGDTGPCGPSSEIYFDKGEEFGPGGGPAVGGSERFVEIWNLVFMQYNALPDGTTEPLPRPSIDTGAGLERILPILEGVGSLFETDLFVPMVDAAQEATGRVLGADPHTDVALRLLADHGRAMTVLVSDGVLPSNEGRGYVLRRLIRRAVLASRRLGVERSITPALSSAAVGVLGDAYPQLREDAGLVAEVLGREEEAFDRTLRGGLSILQGALDAASAAGDAEISGDVAFVLHDTHGFPVELTEELAAEADLRVDREAFDAAMAAQRDRARRAARTGAKPAEESAYRALLAAHGPTEFAGRSAADYRLRATVVGVLDAGEPGTVEVFLDRTPFYAEGGGQLGDHGTITTGTGTAEVFDTVAVLPGLSAHRARVTGEVHPGQEALAAIDTGRREGLRRHHSATHILHAALRTVLGSHVRQQGSLVAPDRLRFDFSHHGPLTRQEIREVEELANSDILTDAPVGTEVTARAEADSMGALSFFGEKYGDVVRVVRAGPHSLELCGGTHVDALGQIGTITIVAEGSVGSNTRRIEAVAGMEAVHVAQERSDILAEATARLRTDPDHLIEAIDRLIERQREADAAAERLRSGALEAEADQLASGAAGTSTGVVAVRRDARSGEELRSLAQAICRRPGVRVAVVGGSPEGAKAALAVAVAPDSAERADATALVREAAVLVKGGGGGTAQLAMAGGRDPDGIDAAIERARQAAGAALGQA